MSVELLTTPTPELVEAMGHLLPQLSRSASPLGADDVERLLSQGGVHLFAFRPDSADASGARGSRTSSWTPARAATARAWRWSRPP